MTGWDSLKGNIEVPLHKPLLGAEGGRREGLKIYGYLRNSKEITDERSAINKMVIKPTKAQRTPENWEKK